MLTKPQTSARPDSLYVYCTAILSQSNYDFTTKSDRNAIEGVAFESTAILASELRSTVAKSRLAEASTTKTQNNSATSRCTICSHAEPARSRSGYPDQSAQSELQQASPLDSAV